MMKKHLCMYMLLTLTIAVTLFSTAQASEPIQVAVSILPQVYFLEQIGGEHVDVLCMLPDGGMPHSYEPTAQQMKQLSRAKLYVRTGVEFENAWWERMASANPDMHVVDSTESLDLLIGHAHEDPEEGEDEHEHHGRDPHVWLSPRSVKIQAENIYQGLIAVDPEHGESYRANTDAFLRELDELDAEIQEKLAKLKIRKFMIFHPAWAYFAGDYDLEQISIEIEGKEPSAKEMVELMRLAKAEQAQVIFVQPQSSRRSAETIAKQIGARVEILDPLAPDWPENMRRVAAILAETLSQ